MALEIPVVTGVIARLPEAATNLAALGGILIPVSFIIEAPILMLLTAATALCRDRGAYRFLRRITLILGGILTLVHALVALTPLYTLVTREILGCPEAVSEAARWGLVVLTPWTMAIAYRRFNQGILIRYGASRMVGMGTVVRLSANITALMVCTSMGGLNGAFIGACALCSGVMAEAIFIGIAVRRVLRERLPERDDAAPELTLASFSEFYIPLAVTVVLDFLIQPLSSGALNRMPQPITGLALLPVLAGLLFILRAPALALNEIVVASLARSSDATVIRGFVRRIGLLCSLAGVIVVVTPVGAWWFGRVMHLPPELVETARFALACALPLVCVAPLKSLYAGILIHRRRTRSISAGTCVYVLCFVIVVNWGIAVSASTGIYVITTAFSIAALIQVVFLRQRVFRSERLSA